MTHAPWRPPTVADEDFVSDDRRLVDASYNAGRGPSGLRELRRSVEEAGRAEWVRRIPLSAAVMRGHVKSTLRYLVEEVRVETLNALVHGRSPLHIAVAWGRVDCAAYLLARGAQLGMRCSEGETSMQKARFRLERLEEKLADEDIPWKSDGSCIGRCEITRICQEGRVLVDFLEEVQEAGSYAKWASLRPEHRLARRFPSGILFTAQEERLRIAVLRALVLAGRAELSREVRVARVVGDAAMLDPGSLEAVMAAAGVGDLADALQELGPFGGVDELRAARLTRRDLERLEVVEAERRRLLRFLVGLQQQPQSQARPKPRARGGLAADARAKAALANAVARTRAAAPTPASSTQAASAPKADVASAPASAGGVAEDAREHASSADADARDPRRQAELRAIAALGLLYDPDLPIGAFMSVAFFLGGGMPLATAVGGA